MEKKEEYLKRFGFLPTPLHFTAKSSIDKRGRRKSMRHPIITLAGASAYLTSREAEVSHLMARGCTMREAAYAVNLSPRTIEFYLCNIRRKLGVRNTTSLLKTLYDNHFFEEKSIKH